jgi:hypothetical protein
LKHDFAAANGKLGQPKDIMQTSSQFSAQRMRQLHQPEDIMQT